MHLTSRNITATATLKFAKDTTWYLCPKNALTPIAVTHRMQDTQHRANGRECHSFIIVALREKVKTMSSGVHQSSWTRECHAAKSIFFFLRPSILISILLQF